MASRSDDYDICPYCNGTGEGMHDGAICRNCRGSGEVKKHDEFLPDDFDAVFERTHRQSIGVMP